MSDTLADLSSWLPSEFLTGDTDDKTLFLNNHNPHHRLRYDFSSSSSTESESDDDDDDIAGLTHRFTRSVSLQERLKIPYPVEKKRGFSGSPESTLNWNVSGSTQVRSSPATPFVRPEEDAWELIYAAAGQVARMKNAVNDGVFVNRGVIGAPRPPGPPLSHPIQNRSFWNNVNEVFIREQQLKQRVSGGTNYGVGSRFVAGRPVVFGQSAWPLQPVETHRRQQPADGFVFKHVPTGPTGGCSRANPVVKKGCAGTGVFLPRNYTNVPPESKIKPVCLPAHLPPARMAQSFNKNLDPIIAKPQQNINGVFTRQYQVPPVQHHNLKYDELTEMIMVHRQNAMMLAQQRRNGTYEGVSATRMGQAEVVLPQEWTY